MLNISPGRNNGAEHHQSEGEESHWCYGTAKPQHFSVCDKDDSQVLEDGVYRDREELERPRACIDHTDEEDRDWEPWFCQSNEYLSRYVSPIHFFASSLLKSL